MRTERLGASVKLAKSPDGWVIVMEFDNGRSFYSEDAFQTEAEALADFERWCDENDIISMKVQ